MNILSLFDGMSCGQIALNRLGIKYTNYFASEIDTHAIKVTKHNYPDTKHLGSVIDVDGYSLPQIDILFGGSPCTSFSFAGKRNGMTTKDNIKILTLEQYLELKENGFEFEGQSYLFWEYVRLLKETKPKYFLLENVVMAKEWENIITNVLGVKPIFINSSLLSAQNRPRLYWTNIPDISIPEDKNILLESVLENFDFPNEPYIENYRSNQAINYRNKKFSTLRAKAGSRTRGIGICDDNGYWRKLLPIECERLQTVPENYTNVVSDNQRYTMLGNGWTVDVISHIFSFIV
jgi:DNA (cytosine-5)-methyltransferase 3A